MLSHRHWITSLLLLFFTIACQGHNYYGNDTSGEVFDARHLEVRAGPGLGTGSPVPHKLRIVAVGDVHGDFDRFLTILKHLDVVNEHGKWSGKVDVFVQLGDLMDRGPDVMILFTYLDDLRVQANNAGGRVYTLLGNHEVANLMYRWDFVNPKELDKFGSTDHKNVRRRALTRDGLIGKSLANNYLGALLLPLRLGKQANAPYDPEKESESEFSHSAIAFVHGGLDPSRYKELLRFPTEINLIAKGLVQRLQDFLFKNVENRPFKDPLTPPQKLLWEAQGPLWYRGLAGKPDCAEVEKMLKDIGARRIVVGHTQNQEGIVENCGGRIIVIDTGITRWERQRDTTSGEYKWIEGVGGMLSALEIQYTFDGKTQKEQVHVVYPGLHDSRKQLENVPF